MAKKVNPKQNMRQFVKDYNREVEEKKVNKKTLRKRRFEDSGVAGIENED